MNIAILLSGGTGQRLGGDIPKQYIKVEGKPIIIYCLETLEKSELIDKVQIVAHNQWISEIKKWAAEYGVDSKICGYSTPGKNRQMSIYNGLLDINDFAAAKTAGMTSIAFVGAEDNDTAEYRKKCYYIKSV